MGKTPKECHYNYFEIKDGRLYYKDMSTSLTTKDGMPRSTSEIARILKKNRLRKLVLTYLGVK